ncbi:MAG: hypothetical protein ACLPTZ_16710 [Beijerinckiaceae bacterium]
MPSGLKSGERRGGRKRCTPNKRTVLTERILALAARHATAARAEFLAIVVDDQILPADIRLAVARRSCPAPRAAKLASKSQASLSAVPTNGITAQSLAALDPLLRITQDITAAEAVRRRAAADIALLFLPHYLGRRTKKRKKFLADEFGFAVDPKHARELRDLDLELECLVIGVSRGRKASPAAFAKKVSTLQARQAEIERELQSPPPEKYYREKYVEQDGTLFRVSLPDQDQATLRRFARRRANKSVLSAEEDTREAHLTARVAAFLNGPEEVARKHLRQLQEKDRAFRTSSGRPLTRAERDTHRLLRLLYPLTPPRMEQIMKRREGLGLQFEHPFLSEPMAPDGNLYPPPQPFPPPPFYIGNPNLPREERLRETGIRPPRRMRDRTHARFVAQQPCLLCGGRPADAHALRFIPHPLFPRFFTDEFMVPLCRVHHRRIHRTGNEMAWWRAWWIKKGCDPKYDPVAKARELWRASHATTTANRRLEASVGASSAIDASCTAPSRQNETTGAA